MTLTREVREKVDYWHSQFHGGGADDCSPDIASPCFSKRLLDALDAAEAEVAEVYQQQPFRVAEANRIRAELAETERDEAVAKAAAHDGFGGGPSCHETLAEAMERAERAEAAMARVEALVDTAARFGNYVRWTALRAALDTPATEGGES